VRTARVLRGAPAAFLVLACTAVLAQRIQFPSQLPSPGPVPSPVVPGHAPSATLSGTIQGPPADFDPYATYPAYPMAPHPLLAQDPMAQGAPLGAPAAPVFSYATMRRLFEELRLDYVWMPGSAADELGINDVELSTTVNFPFLYNEAPLQVTPGFAVHYWNGPETLPPAFADLPSRTYDAYLEGAWDPRITTWLRGELAFRIGVYSDLDRVTSDSLRYQGRGLAVFAFSPTFTLKAGVWYLDRVRVQILPAGGIVWMPGGPNGDTRFEVLFPNPKLARRITRVGDTDWWAYLRGEYGGGSWHVTRISGVQERVDYNDIRVALGLEFVRASGFSGLFEAGVAFDREIVYKIGPPDVFSPNTTVFLRGGLAF